jgi:subfamily B ATP-binding cassette protein MsbA
VIKLFAGLLPPKSAKNKVMSKIFQKIMSDGPTRRLAARLFNEHVMPYRVRFLFAIVFMILAAVANGAIPFILQPVFDDVFYKGNPDLLF